MLCWRWNVVSSFSLECAGLRGMFRLCSALPYHLRYCFLRRFLRVLHSRCASEQMPHSAESFCRITAGTAHGIVFHKPRCEQIDGTTKIQVPP